MEFVDSRGLLSGVDQGRDKGRGGVRDVPEPWDSLRWEPEELIELGDDRVLTDGGRQRVGREAGYEVKTGGASGRFGPARRGRSFYQSKGEALEAAGLRE